MNPSPQLQQTAAFTVDEFCVAHGRMSRTLFYELLKNGRGPRIFKAGRKTLVSVEAATAWRAAMEAGAAKEAA